MLRVCRAVVAAIAAAALLVVGTAFPASAAQTPRVLVFTKVSDPQQAHDSTPETIELLEMNSRRYGFDLEATDDASRFNAAELANFDVVLWLNTYGDVLDSAQQDAFADWVESGGGYVGVHSAARTEPEWDFYQGLIGAQVVDDEDLAISQRDVTVMNDNDHAAAQNLPSELPEHEDQWYRFDDDPGQDDDTVVLAETTIDNDDDSVPVAWAQPAGEGRSWYTVMGHKAKPFEDGEFLKLLRGGMWWAADMDDPPMVNTASAAPAWPYVASFLAWIVAVAAGGSIAVVRLNRRDSLL